jgi:DNA-binding beta-propeller fold protein YncE
MKGRRNGENVVGSTVASWGAVSCLTLAVLAGHSCDEGAEEGGATHEEGSVRDNRQRTGRQERGEDPGTVERVWFEREKEDVAAEDSQEQVSYKWEYQLQYSDVILSPDGNNVLSMVPMPGPDLGFEKPGLVLTVQPLPSGERRVFPQIQNLERINFSPDGGDAYLLNEGGMRITVLDLQTYTYEAVYHLSAPFSVSDVTPDGKYLVLSNLPVTDVEEATFDANNVSCLPPAEWGLPSGASLCQAGFVELETGNTWTTTLPHRIRDVDFCPLSQDVFFTYSTRHGNSTTPTKSNIVFYDLKTSVAEDKLQFENCADELVVSAASGLALLSPTTCIFPPDQKELDANEDPPPVFQDPISVITLGSREFLGNLPGFGPVAVTPDGSLAVGFTRREVLESDWDYWGQSEPFGLIFVNTQTLEWEVVDFGHRIPAYTISPDGAYLYLYVDHDPSGKQTLSRMSLQPPHSRVTMSGPAVELDQFVWTAQGDTMYFISNSGLYLLGNYADSVTWIPMVVFPELLALRPQGDYLVLGEDDQPTFYTAIFPTPGHELPTESTFDLALGGSVAQ